MKNIVINKKNCLVALSISLILNGIAIGSWADTSGLTLIYNVPPETQTIPDGSGGTKPNPCYANWGGSNQEYSSALIAYSDKNNAPTSSNWVAASSTPSPVIISNMPGAPSTKGTGQSFPIVLAGTYLLKYIQTWGIPGFTTPVPICTVSNSTSTNPVITDMSTLFDQYENIKPGPDYTNPNASITVNYDACGTASGSDGYSGPIPTFHCVFNGFAAASPKPKNVIIMGQIPDTTVNLNEQYDRANNPLLDLGSYFKNYNQFINGYETPGQRTYYGITIGGGTGSAQSITSSTSTKPIGLDLTLATAQRLTGGSASSRENISTDDQSLTAPDGTLCPATTTNGSTYYTCTINICACDPGLAATQIGSCFINGTGSSLIPALSQGVEPANYVDNLSCSGQDNTKPGPVFQSFKLFITTPFRAASVQELASNNLTNTTGLTRFVVPVSTSSKSLIPLGQYFIDRISSSGTPNFINSTAQVTYAIVDNITTPSPVSLPNGYAVGQSDGNGGINHTLPDTDPSDPNLFKEPLLSQYTATSDWSPIKIMPNTEGAGTPSVDGVALTIDPSGKFLSVDASQFNPINGDKNGGIYQVTIQATSHEPGSSGATAYQTIYLNVSSENSAEYDANGNYSSSNPGTLVYTPLKPFNSMWIYMPGYVTNNTPIEPPATSSLRSNNSFGDNPNPSDSACVEQPSANSNDPCAVYSNTLTQLSNSANNLPIQYLTPDMMWIAFKDSQTSYPPVNADGTYTSSPIDNNFYTDSGQHIQNMLSYFAKYNPNVDIVLTAEMDNPVMGNLSTMQNALPPTAIPGKDFSQMDRLVWSTVLPFTPSGNNRNSASLSGLEFDIEPFKNSPAAVQYYKRVSDVLARHGKIFNIFAFADAAMPIKTASVTMAMGPLGIFHPSMYDVGNTTDPDYSSTYAENFMPKYDPKNPNAEGQILQALFPNSYSYNIIDNNCHWSNQLADNYGPTNSPVLPSPLSLPIQGYCNIDLTNTVYNNAVLMGFQGGNPSFTQAIATYGGHFQMAIPSNGSAENYTAQIIINPTCSQVAETNDNGNPNPPAYNPLIVNSDTYSKVLGSTACPALADSTTMVNTIPGIPSNFIYGGQVPTAIAKAINANGAQSSTTIYPINDASLNTIMPLLSSNLKVGTYYMGSDAYCNDQVGGTPDECRYLIYLSNPNNETTADGGLNTVAQKFSALNQGPTPSQDVYLKALIDFAKGDFDSEFLKNTGVPDMLTPSENNNNLGFAMYSLNSESVIGCFYGESHAFKPNCLLALPVTTPLNDPTTSTVQLNPLWTTAHAYTNPTAMDEAYTLSNFSAKIPTNAGSNAVTVSVTLGCDTDLGINKGVKLFIQIPVNTTLNQVYSNVPLACGNNEITYHYSNLTPTAGQTIKARLADMITVTWLGTDWVSSTIN